MNKDTAFVFQGVKSFLGACRALSDGAMEWYQPDISFFGEMFLNSAPSQSNAADMDTHSYNSNLEFELRVFNCYR